MKWLREMIRLLREYRKADRDYKAAAAKVAADMDAKYASWQGTIADVDAFLEEEYDRTHVQMPNGEIAHLLKPLEFWEAYVQCLGFTGNASQKELARAKKHVEYLRNTESRVE